jgi:hypothetical protein
MTMQDRMHDTEAITQALAAGKITVPDSATGYQRSIYADCPHDGQPVMIRRVVRSMGGAITEIIMRCSTCGQEFSPQREQLYLH